MKSPTSNAVAEDLPKYTGETTYQQLTTQVNKIIFCDASPDKKLFAYA